MKIAQFPKKLCSSPWWHMTENGHLILIFLLNCFFLLYKKSFFKASTPGYQRELNSQVKSLGSTYRKKLSQLKKLQDSFKIARYILEASFFTHVCLDTKVRIINFLTSSQREFWAAVLKKIPHKGDKESLDRCGQQHPSLKCNRNQTR